MQVVLELVVFLLVEEIGFYYTHRCEGFNPFSNKILTEQRH